MCEHSKIVPMMPPQGTLGTKARKTVPNNIILPEIH